MVTGRIASKYIRSFFTFYRNYFFSGFAISLSCMWLYSALGNPSLTILCWFKAITTVIFVSYVNSYKRKEFLYYQNIGITKRQLWLATIITDFILFSIVMILAR